MRLALAQLNPLVGDLEGNGRLIEQAGLEAMARGADLLLTPELSLWGYPPRDLLLRPALLERQQLELTRLAACLPSELAVLVGVAEPTIGAGSPNLYNALALVEGGGWRVVARKQLLPSYDVFDERRYFLPGDQAAVLELERRGRRWRLGLSICEDLWVEEALQAQRLVGADPIAELESQSIDLLLNLSASPFGQGKLNLRQQLAARAAVRLGCPVVYVNQVGGNDDLVFDGASFVVDAAGRAVCQLACSEEQLGLWDAEPTPPGPFGLVNGAGGEPPAAAALLTQQPLLTEQPLLTQQPAAQQLLPQPPLPTEVLTTEPLPMPSAAMAAASPADQASPAAPASPDVQPAAKEQPAPQNQPAPEDQSALRGQGFLQPPPLQKPPSAEEQLLRVLVLGVRDYARKCGFRGALLGLSGGIDSALVALIASAALGAQRVSALLMPSPWSSPGSLSDAEALANRLGLTTDIVAIAQLMAAFDNALSGPLAGPPQGLTAENLQSRIRGTLLMAVANQQGQLLLATGNKSELAVGYCTLYGDMNGGLAVIGDLYKTTVFGLCDWIDSPAAAPCRAALGLPASGELIGAAIRHKPPSAELRPDQRDSDSLPDYAVLDPLLKAYIEGLASPEQLLAAGSEPELTLRVHQLLRRAEFKRRQAAPALKVSGRSFGAGWRMPIAAA